MAQNGATFGIIFMNNENMAPLTAPNKTLD